ncbi:motility associated factor glycosyltransferase family protein [Bacillus sp. AK031]
MNWKLKETKSGHQTVVLNKAGREFLLHSKYNPILEANRWVSQWEIDKHLPKKIVIVGIGAGFHIARIIEKYAYTPIEVWDFNPGYVDWLKKNKVLDELNPKIKNHLFVTDDMSKVQQKLLPRLNEEDTMFLIHSPSLELIPPKLLPIKEALERFLVFLRTIRRHGDQLINNFSDNCRLNDNGIKEWELYLLNKPSILISAGPSLTKQLPYLKMLSESGEYFLACVGTALTPLLIAGIEPDIVMVSDPQENIKNQLKNKSIEIPLFYLSTANHTAVKEYIGPRFIVWQKGFFKSEEQAQLRNEPVVETGGSVATCLLDLLMWMGCSKVALIGQDLAFTNGYSHAVGTHAHHSINSSNLIEVEDYYRQGKVNTSKNLYIYLKWFQSYRSSISRGIELWNCTEGGAYIPGWIHRSLKEYTNV